MSKQFFIMGLSDLIVAPTWFNNDQSRGHVPDGLDPLRSGMAHPGTEEYNETTVEQTTKEWLVSGSMYRTERGHWIKYLAGQLAVNPESVIWVVDGYPATLLSFVARDLSQMIDNMTQWSANMKPRQTALMSGREIECLPSPVEVMQSFYKEAKNWNTEANLGRPKVFYTHTPKYKNLRDLYIEAEKWSGAEDYEFCDFHNRRLEDYVPEISQYIIAVEQFARQQRQGARPSLVQPASAPPDIKLV